MKLSHWRITGARKTGIDLRVLLNEDIDEHKKYCGYGFTCCIGFSKCIDVFHYNDVEDHYKMKHPECIRKSEYLTHKLTHRWSAVYEEGIVLIPAHGYLLKMFWMLDVIICKL
ncbi:hypothetical protein HHI36_004658 [Cryptolaemus montrouzieri]|uniref:Uncharacterized protein n=1 Tax=Cryptolaemus montrouzieri TaxID=559131 RepID=A0ABD2NS73_9CUCU